MAPSVQQASEFLKTNEFSYQGMSTNTGEKNFSLWADSQREDSQKLEVLPAVQAFICVILSKLLYLAPPFLPEKLREKYFPLHREDECM